MGSCGSALLGGGIVGCASRRKQAEGARAVRYARRNSKNHTAIVLNHNKPQESPYALCTSGTGNVPEGHQAYTTGIRSGRPRHVQIRSNNRTLVAMRTRVNGWRIREGGRPTGEEGEAAVAGGGVAG